MESIRKKKTHGNARKPPPTIIEMKNVFEMLIGRFDTGMSQ